MYLALPRPHHCEPCAVCRVKQSNFAALILIFILSLPTMTLALPEDTQKKLNIEANSSIFNYKTRIDTYEGNVKVNQGTSHVIADKLVTQKDRHHKLILATATGIQRLAEYTTTPKEGDPPLHAWAKIIKFYPQDSMVILEQDVTVTQQDNSFHGPLIIYNIKGQTVTAPPSTQGRATIVIGAGQIKS
jgi:lipopolysaccharide export system protein LptA